MIIKNPTIKTIKNVLLSFLATCLFPTFVSDQTLRFSNSMFSCVFLFQYLFYQVMLINLMINECVYGHMYLG